MPIAVVFGFATTESQIELSRIRLAKSTTGVTNAAFRVHLCSAPCQR